MTDFPCCETDSHATETETFSVEVAKTVTETIHLTPPLCDAILAGRDLYIDLSAQERMGVAKYLLHRYPQREGINIHHINNIIYDLRGEL